MIHFKKYAPLVLIALSLLSCTKKGRTTEQGPKELTMWAHEEVPFKNGFVAVGDAYNKESSVKLSLQTFPYDAYVQKIQTMMASQTGPDIIETFGVWMLEYKKTGAVLEMPEELNNYVKENYFDTVQGAYRDGGELYGLPFEYNIEGSVILTYPSAFSEKGLDYPPKTWQDFINAGKALTKYDDDQKIVQRGFDFISYDSILFFFLQLILQQGGSYLEDGAKVNFQSPEAIQAMNIMKNLIVKDQVTDLSLLSGDSEPIDLFFKGDSAIAMRGPWAVGYGESAYNLKLGTDFDYMLMPPYRAGEPRYFASESGWGLAIPTKSAQPTLALEFLQFFSRKENNKLFNTISHTIPAHKKIMEDPEFLENNKVAEIVSPILENGVYIGDLNTDFLKDQFFEVFPAIVDGSMSVEDGLSQIEGEVNNF